MSFDKNNKDFFSNFDKENDEGDFFNFDDKDGKGFDPEGDDFYTFDDEEDDDEWDDDDEGLKNQGVQEESQGDIFNFKDDEDDYIRTRPTENKGDFNFDEDEVGERDERNGETKGGKGRGILGAFSRGIDWALDAVGISEDSMFHKILKYGVYLVLILFIVFFVIGYLIIGTLFGGDSEGDYSEPQPVEDKTFFEGVNDKILGIFGGDSESSNTSEGIDDVELEASYEEDYLSLAQNNVFRYKQPATVNGTTFKIFNVEPYEDLMSEESEREYIKVDFGIKNESTQDIKFTEYDFKMYTKEALESKDTEDKGYIGIDEESKNINVNVEDLSESVKGLFVSKGIEPTIIRMGDKSTSVGRGVVKPDEVYSAFVVFEVVPNEEKEYILGFNPAKYPFEILIKTYE